MNQSKAPDLGMYPALTAKEWKEQLANAAAIMRLRNELGEVQAAERKLLNIFADIDPMQTKAINFYTPRVYRLGRKRVELIKELTRLELKDKTGV